MSSADPLIGAELGDFRPVALLGQGGMGAVYEAEDLALSRRVALKVLLSRFAEDARARARFQREIEHAVAMEHPHVVPIYAAGYERPHFYLAMRLVPGPDLARIVRDDGPLDEIRALRILGQVASALHAVHDKGLVHRDIKPHNVLLWGAGSSEEHAMLTDFGIAKALDDTQSITGLTALGTPAYMAPEVCLGQLATPACDQYSLGCMAYELLSGAPPFDGDAVTLREAHVEQQAPSLADVAPHLSPAVVKAVDTALVKDPRKRHKDVRQMALAAEASDDAFQRSRELRRVMAEANKPQEAAVRLSSEHGMSDEKVSQLTDLDRTEVVRLRRRHARRALVGRRQG
ncbi:MAG: serine/threonine protein kinase [Solirubrobacteraceae bacterium MAG38_C4-C5]|nr:serine/threonine protein kinase [Candidatus Siliceabacter maunaloa]